MKKTLTTLLTWVVALVGLGALTRLVARLFMLGWGMV